MQASFSELDYASKKKQTRRDRFLADIEAVAPWASLVSVIAAHYPSSGGRGRPPIGWERMLRRYVAQHCFGLSDEGIEDAPYDSQAIRRFVGIDLGREAAPDATTLLEFRRLLEEHQLTAAICSAINAQLAERGSFMRADSIVDATIIAAPSSTQNPQGVFGDAGYRGVEKREENLELPVTKHLFRHRKARYRGLARNTAQLFPLFGFANLMLTRRWLLGADSQVAS